MVRNTVLFKLLRQRGLRIPEDVSVIYFESEINQGSRMLNEGEWPMNSLSHAGNVGGLNYLFGSMNVEKRTWDEMQPQVRMGVGNFGYLLW